MGDKGTTAAAEFLGFDVGKASHWVWICYIFLNSFQRDSPASLNSTGLM